MARKHECYRHVITCGVAVVEHSQGSNIGRNFYPRVRLHPGGYYYTTGVRVPPGTFTLGYDNPPRKSGRYSFTTGVQLPPGTSTLPGYDYPPYTGGYFCPARVRLPPVLLPCHGAITPRYFYPARVRLPPIHRGVLSPCQGRITPR